MDEPNATPAAGDGSNEITAESSPDLAGTLAEALCLGFKHHDERNREACLDAFHEVDRHQLDHLSDDEARRAAAGYVDALWAKDEVEAPYEVDGDLDREGLASADWSPVREALERRADAAGIDPAYARLTAEAWRAHKVGEDYWTPMGEAQVLELRVALGDPDHPEKPSDGRNGLGPLATRYLLGVELHDMHTEDHWREAIETMRPYYEAVLDADGGAR